MPDETDDERFDRITAELTNRGLGDIEMRAHAATRDLREAQMEAAANLLEKAFNALRDGDDARAHQMARRAADLPFDEGEQAQPGAWQAHLMMFTVVTDELEEVEGDGWLDAALETLATAPEHGRFSMRDCLVAIAQDYELPPEDLRRIHRGVEHVPEKPELHELSLAGDDLAAAMLEVLRGVIAFEDALD